MANVKLSEMATSFALGEEINARLAKELFAEWGSGKFVACRPTGGTSSSPSTSLESPLSRLGMGVR